MNRKCKTSATLLLFFLTAGWIRIDTRFTRHVAVGLPSDEWEKLSESVSTFALTEHINYLLCNGDSDVMAVGENGLIASYKDKHWTEKKLGGTSFTRAVVNGNVIWILEHLKSPESPATGTGKLFRTIDSGETWKGKTPANAAGFAGHRILRQNGVACRARRPNISVLGRW